MSEEVCDSSENVIRAIHKNSFDQNILNSGAFETDTPLSVSRLSILPLENISEITKRDLGDKYVALAELNVGGIIDAGKELKVELKVVPNPVNTPGKENPSHAEVIGRITGGISKRLKKNVLIFMILIVTS